MNLNKGLVRIQTKTNIGTGFIVSSSGIVFTCKHVIENFHPEDKDDNFILLFNLNEDVGRFEGEKYEYKILFPDLNDETYPYDFAILYIIPKSPKIFDYVKLGLEPSNIMRENKPLKLIGLSPDENWTKSKAYDGSLLNYTVFKSSKCLDIDTPITPGMSGGPVYSQHSESVIGLSIDQALRITKTKIKEVKIIDFRAYAITMSKIQKIIKEQDVLPEIIKKEILDKFQITKTFDNYDSMMEVSDETPISFEYIEPNSVVKYVNHAAIEAGIIIRIERLHEEINNLMFNSSKKWVLLYGDSGMSKTSQAKIILHDIRQRYIEQNKIINICIIDNIKKISNENKTLTLEELIQVIKQSTEEWLLLLDDLHDSTSGKISEKLKLISNLPKDKVYLIATSRLSLDFLKEFCEGISRARKSIDYFKEVNFLLYNKEINKAKQKLIESLRPELNRDEMFKIEYSKYSTNFIFLILAIKYWKPGETHSLIEGLQNFLEKEFSSILEKNRFLKPKILFRTFVGACFEGVFDEDISYDYFSTKEDSEEDIQTALSLLASEGLLIQSEPNYDKNGVKILKYKVQHARMAELYLDAFIPAYLFKKINFKFDILCTLNRFRVRINTGLQFEKFFPYFIDLEELEIQNNKLAIIPDLISTLSSLKKLNLLYNRIEELPESICGLTSLQTLILSSNQLKELPESICGLSSLQTLNLSSNQLKELPESIGGLTSLQTLILSSNQLKELPESIGGLTSLQKLVLDSNALKELPESIGGLTSLQTLILSSNQLKELPDTIGNLTTLHKLDLRFTKLKELPESIGGLTSLLKLVLDSNDLKELPESIGGLTSLQTLILSSNQLKELPESIGGLTSLQTLIFSSNQLKELPESIGGLMSLQDLSLETNQLKELPKSISGLTLLQTLILSSNQLKELPESIGGLTSLQKLVLDTNQLKELPKSITNRSSLQILIKEA